MPRNIEKPVRVARPDDPVFETIETHPAYAQIQVNRVGGTHAALYQSDFTHQYYLTLSIRSSELYIDGSRETPMPKEEYIEVALSESQWATLVSSMNMGGGVPCTLMRHNGKFVPMLPGPPDRRTQFAELLHQRMKLARDAIYDLRTKIENAALSGKAKKDYLSDLVTIERNVDDNVAYVADRFSEHMEVTIEHGKGEVMAFMHATATAAGLKALAHEQPVKLIDQNDNATGEGT